MSCLANQQISHPKDSYAPFVDCFDILLARNQCFHQSNLQLYCVKLYVRKSPTKGITSYNNSSQLYCKIKEFYEARMIYSVFYIDYLYSNAYVFIALHQTQKYHSTKRPKKNKRDNNDAFRFETQKKQNTHFLRMDVVPLLYVRSC